MIHYVHSKGVCVCDLAQFSRARVSAKKFGTINNPMTNEVIERVVFFVELYLLVISLKRVFCWWCL